MISGFLLLVRDWRNLLPHHTGDESLLCFEHTWGKVTFASRPLFAFKELEEGIVCTFFVALLASASNLVSGFG